MTLETSFYRGYTGKHMHTVKGGFIGTRGEEIDLYRVQRAAWAQR
jgi:hypothetical protein